MTYSLFVPQSSPGVRTIPPRVPRASHRHASPSGPWPWTDLVDDGPYDPQLDSEDRQAADEHHTWTWMKYPSSLYPNWTQTRVERSGIAKVINSRKHTPCKIYHIDVGEDGTFSDPAQHVVNDENKHQFWKMMQHKRPGHTRVRALFVEDLSGSVLQMLGTKHNIEPFFFSSSLNWIPTRYQESIQRKASDHITITLIFLRTILNPTTRTTMAAVTPSPGFLKQVLSRSGTAVIDPQAPLVLRSNDKVLVIDILALHMVRSKDCNTIISYHPPPEWQGTSAKFFHSRVRFAGQSVYWQGIFRQSNDPTFVLLSMLWYALYSWDESLESLDRHICTLEAQVLITNDIHLTRELHNIRRSLLHYTSLLDDFRKTVLFVLKTPNPAMEDDPGLQESAELMDRECDTLISEIERLEMARSMQDMRLENVMNLAFSSVNFEDSRDMQKLTESSLRDSAAMKQISYLTMVFLPASFVASAFGMNIKELSPGTVGTLAHYFAVVIPLTALTVWMIMALRNKAHHEETSFWNQLQWPLIKMHCFIRKKKHLELQGMV